MPYQVTTAAKELSPDNVTQQTSATTGPLSALRKLTTAYDANEDRRDSTKTPKDTIVAMNNQFSALTTATPANIASVRSISVVSKTRLRVRISDQPCVVIGTCTLWIKKGTVSICGTRIDNAQKPHHLYSPTSHALPVIEAVEGQAEFELESSDIDTEHRGMQSLTEIGFPDVWRPQESDEPATLTFSILGFHCKPDPSTVNHYRLLDTTNWQSNILGLASASGNSAGAPRYLIHGAPNSGTSTFAQNLLNCLTSRYPASTGVAFVDLEAVRPAFTPPGTICLQQVKTAVFGPPFTRPAANSGPVTKCHFVGGQSSMTEWYFRCCIDLLEYEAATRGLESRKPVIIHAPKWLTSLSIDDSAALTGMKRQLWQALRPTNVIYLSNSDDGFLKSVPTDTTIKTEQIRQKPFQQYNFGRQSDMSTQAYFHMIFDEKTGNRFFDKIPILQNQPKTFHLSFAEWGPLKGVIVNHTTLAAESVRKTITGKLAAVLSVSVAGLNAAGYWEMDRGQGLLRLQGDLDRTDLLPRESKFLGLGYVHNVDEKRQRLSIITPIKAAVLEKPYEKGESTHLVLVVPAGDAAWLHREVAKV